MNMDGFLDNLPDIRLPNGKRKRRKKPAVRPEDVCVRYVRLKCPRCNSRKVPVYDSSHLPIRYHKCTKCGLNFKSVEQ